MISATIKSFNSISAWNRTKTTTSHTRNEFAIKSRNQFARNQFAIKSKKTRIKSELKKTRFAHLT